MADGLEVKRKLWDRLKDSYRITIIDDENLEEIGSYNLSLLNFYILLSFLGLLLTIIVVSFIIFTPVKTLIPGYGEISENKKFIELSRKVDALENEVSAYDTYTKGLQNLLTGGIYNSSVEKLDSIVDSKSKLTQMVNQDEMLETKRAKELSFLKFAVPVFGKISANFEPEVRHFGVDILAAKDSPIKSILDGIVINADQSLHSGNSVYIQHNKNLVSVYKHNSALLVKIGDIVKTGQAIAIIGNTGEMSTGPHLHFEMWYDGKYVNPINYITFQ